MLKLLASCAPGVRVISSRLMVDRDDDDCGSTSLAVAVTHTSCFTSASDSAIWTTGVLPDATAISCRSAANPGTSAVTTYFPSGTLAKTNSPFWSVTPDCFQSEFSAVSVMDTPD